MNCHRARIAILERELGQLTLGHERALDEHLVACAACRTSVQCESLLIEGLRELRGRELPSVDVGVRVMRQISTLAPVETLPVPQRQLAWSALAALATAVALVAGIWPHGGWLRQAAGRGLDAGGAMVSAALSVVAALKSLLVLPWRILASLEQTLAPLAASLGRFEPLAITGVSLGLLSMLLTIAWVVGNDLRRPLRRPE